MEFRYYEKAIGDGQPSSAIRSSLGTLFMPDRMPQKYGTDDPVPPLYHQQLAYPFVGSTERLAQPARLAEASPTPAGKSD